MSSVPTVCCPCDNKLCARSRHGGKVFEGYQGNRAQRPFFFVNRDLPSAGGTNELPLTAGTMPKLSSCCGVWICWSTDFAKRAKWLVGANRPLPRCRVAGNGLEVSGTFEQVRGRVGIEKAAPVLAWSVTPAARSAQNVCSFILLLGVDYWFDLFAPA